MKTEKIKVLRAFILDGSPTKVGDVIVVPASLGIELRTAKKAEKVVEPPAEKPVEPVIEPKAATPQKGVK
jgi:hypothetical protein